MLGGRRKIQSHPCGLSSSGAASPRRTRPRTRSGCPGAPPRRSDRPRQTRGWWAPWPPSWQPPPGAAGSSSVGRGWWCS